MKNRTETVTGEAQGRVSVKKRHRLTEAERRHIYNREMAKEQALNPGYRIEVSVAYETDDDGNPKWTVVRSRESTADAQSAANR